MNTVIRNSPPGGKSPWAWLIIRQGGFSLNSWQRPFEPGKVRLTKPPGVLVQVQRVGRRVSNFQDHNIW